MIPITTNLCVLTFNTSLDAKRLVRIPDPRAGLSAPNIVAAAGGFMAVNPFDETIGSLTGLDRAELVTETRTELF